MTDIQGRTNRPDREEMTSCVGIPLFRAFCAAMERDYQPLCRIEYSGEKAFSGWNLKFRKADALHRLPRRGHFLLLPVVGPREKERAEALLPTLPEDFRERCRGTREFMGQRWMVLDFRAPCGEYEGALRVIRIRRESKR